MKSQLDKTKSKTRQIASLLIAVTSVALIGIAVLPEIALAAKFNIDTGINSGINPLIRALDDHWGKLVGLVGITTAILGEGDGRQRAVKAAIFSALAGGVIIGLLAMIGEIPKVAA